jgi:8-oxo-dGTP pyrophosphatase MutT (NUDIX family)/HD superfamily phosphodiesterase
MTEPSTPERTACGFVLVRESGRDLSYLTLVNRERDECGLPKGHAEPGETERVTALRETQEETGLSDVEFVGDFRAVLAYRASRQGVDYRKRVVYFVGRCSSSEVRLSREHSSYAWLGLHEAIESMPFDALKDVVLRAALFLKDPALFDVYPATEREADAYLAALPGASDSLVGHLRGGARLARRLAEAVQTAGVGVHVEATAVGTLLHDIGRALGDHDDHQCAGLRHLRRTPLAAYGFACISHFTKGADAQALLDAGLARTKVREFNRLTDLSRMTWEEQCAALADSCMRGAEAVPPELRFADLRRRYDARTLIDLQERMTAQLRQRLERVLGRDPLQVVDLE